MKLIKKILMFVIAIYFVCFLYNIVSSKITALGQNLKPIKEYNKYFSHYLTPKAVFKVVGNTIIKIGNIF